MLLQTLCHPIPLNASLRLLANDQTAPIAKR
jgi:hypothetical protein